jgi:hydrogenase nickel incorporation protein HypB
MCSTCGCSDAAHTTITDLGSADSHRHRDAKTNSHHDETDHHHDLGDHIHSHEHHQEHRHSHEDDSHPESGARMLLLEQDLLAKNSRLAERNRGWLEAREVWAVNLMSSPGAGKTTLLERTIRDLGKEQQISVVEGDQATTRDAERIGATGCRVIQINTGSGCHLDSEMLADALKKLQPPAHSLVMIENVGNLVCPALFDLGERRKVVIMSVTEGEDKPLKYPHMFRAGDLMIINKVDLLPYVSFSMERCIDYAKRVNPNLRIITTSATRGDGLEAWYSWIRAEIALSAAAHDAGSRVV